MQAREAMDAANSAHGGPKSLSAASQVSAIRRRDQSIRESIEAGLSILDVAETHGAIAWRRDAEALAEAEAADAQLANGGSVRPLEGLPVTVKELLAVEGRRWDLGSAALAGSIAPGDATILRRLRAAGAILVAATTSAEMGALPTTENARGACTNPHDKTRTSGGSSGGAAVCASLGIAINHGSDGGGSVRIPASCCGVVGLKPSRGRISGGPYSGDGWGGMSVQGCLTRTVADTALFLDTVAGPAPGDLSALPFPARPFLEALSDIRPRRIGIAVSRDGHDVDSAARAAVTDAADRLSNLGHEVSEIEISFADIEQSFGVLSMAGISSLPVPPERFSLLLPRTRTMFESTQKMSASDVMKAMHVLAVKGHAYGALFTQVDALLTPTLPSVAPLLGQLGADPENAWADYGRFLQWTWPFNALGHPAISIPAPGGGLPIGLQVVAAPGHEATCIALGAQLEAR